MVAVQMRGAGVGCLVEGHGQKALFSASYVSLRCVQFSWHPARLILLQIT